MILERIRQYYPKLTKSQKRLADYVAVSYQEAAFMTASRLARTLLVNEATVIRFAQRLGYPGYPELVRDIQEMVQDELRTRGQDEEPALEQESLLTALDGAMETLQRAMGRITPDLARQMRLVLCGAERVLVVGQGVSGALASVMCSSLRALGVAAENPAVDPLSLAIALDDITPACTIVGISATEESWEVANALRYAAERGARTLALAWSPVAPVAQAAEVAICCPVDERRAPSVTVIATMIDALVQMVAAGRADGSSERDERLARLREYLTEGRLR